MACSGGADSLALAHLAVRAATEQSRPLPVIAHINHGLRAEASAEAAAVRAFASTLGAVCIVREVRLDSKGASLEARAREARYRALDDCAAEVGANWVLFAHTLSDQAETVFMRIVRGTGLVGLSGMSPTRGKYARPLLGVTREDTEAYCKQHNLQYTHDPMNRDLRFTRVRIRHRWLPQLREENPRIQDALCGLADSARDHRDVLDWAAETALRSLETETGLQLGASFSELPDSLAARVVALYTERGTSRPLERAHVEALLKLCRSPTGGSRQLSLPGGEAIRVYDELRWAGTAAATKIAVPPGFATRRWQFGDRMRPARLKGRSRKLSDLFADAKIPAAERPNAWVVTSEEGEIIWAQHIGHAHGWSIPVRLTRSEEQVPE